MMKLQRGAAPDFLKENYKQWGKDYEQMRLANPSTRFNWRSYAGVPVDKQLKSSLNAITKNHCSYCDGFPLGTTSLETIDHFRPKSKYPCLAYVWHNLFLCCTVCQQAKRDTFDKKLLKPDVQAYQFHTYFTVNYSNGEIAANPAASSTDQDRANFTINVFGLNKPGRPESRFREYCLFQLAGKSVHIDDFSYRFFMI
ncbi:MAG: TIGR02646 family protein [Rhizobacter sp.]|nr:TIGR02646 family protein [Chlorobiales bacterium]